jgi:hypothetical protein
MTEKNILEQALLQINTLEEAVKQNAKGILASTMKEELKDLLKESLEDEEEVTSDDEETTPGEEENDMSDDESAETADDDAEDNEDLDKNEPTTGIDGFDSEEGDEEDSMGGDTSFGDFGGADSEEDSEEDSDDEDVMDMTGASDAEVIKVFRAMRPEDGIVVKKDGNKVEFHDGDNDYIIKLDESEMEEENMYEIDLEEDEDAPYETEVHEDNAPYSKKVGVKKGMHEDGDAPYETEVHEDADAPYAKKVGGKKMQANELMLDPNEKPKAEKPKADKPKGNKEQADEAARTYGADVRKPANQGMKYKAGRHEMNEEVEKLKKQNGEYRKALVLFKDKLNEVAVFNANLAYATRLFTENSTTKQEKLNILKRFDSVSTLQESKSLFNTINTELGSKTTVTESVVEKISNTPSTSASQEVLAESKAYEAPQFARMRDLMKKVK